MNPQDTPPLVQPTRAETEKPTSQVVATIGTVAGAAFATFFLGAIFGAAWPAAVASCGISAMGAVVAVFMLKRS